MTAAPVDLQTPCDLDAERAVLGAMLQDADARAVALRRLRPVDFAVPEHARLFGFLADVLASSLEPEEKPDFITVAAALKAAGVFEELGGREFLINLYDSCATFANTGSYSTLVRQKAALRQAMQAGLDLVRQTAQTGADATALLVEAQKGLKRIAQRMRRTTFMTAADLLANCRDLREPIIDGLIRRGEVGNLVASPKWNKSWLLLFIAVCVAFGRAVFNFPTRAGRVLLLDYELALGTLAHRLHTILAAMGLSDADIGDRLAIESLRGRRLDITGLGTYFDALPPGRFDLILIDPLYRTFPPDMDENSNANLADLYATLQGYAEELDAAVFVVHHLTKGNQSFKAITDLGSGGGSQSRAADAHLAIRPHAQDDVGVLSGVLRSFPPFKPFAIRWRFPLWELADDLDPTDLRHQGKSRSKTSKTAAPAEPEPPRPDITTFLGPDPALRDAIVAKARAGGIGLSERATLQAIERAEASGEAFRWKMPPDRRRVYYANRRQPQLEAVDD